MADVVVDTALLYDVSAQLAAVPAAVRLPSSFADPLDAAMGSAIVSGALHDAGVEQVARSGFVADALAAVSPQAAVAADRFEAADRRLARAF